MRITGYVSILIPVDVEYDEGQIPPIPDQVKEDVRANLMDHPALTNGEYMQGYITGIRLELQTKPL